MTLKLFKRLGKNSESCTLTCGDLKDRNFFLMCPGIKNKQSKEKKTTKNHKKTTKPKQNKKKNPQKTQKAKKKTPKKTPQKTWDFRQMLKIQR